MQDMIYGILAVIAMYLLYRVIVGHLFTRRCEMFLSRIPKVANTMPFLGVATELSAGEPWNKFTTWAKQKGNTFQFQIMGERLIYTTEPKLIRRVLQTKQTNYSKANDFVYKHFMCLLGKGLVTSEGEQWRRNRILLSHAFRVELLDDIPRLSVNAVVRLFKQLTTAEKKKESLDLCEEFRVLTLEVIASAILSMGPEESEAVFPKLYLPIATECNKRSWAPWRQFYPSTALKHRQLCGQLDSFFEKFVSDRKALREKEATAIQEGDSANATAAQKAAAATAAKRKRDILDRCIEKMEPNWNKRVSVAQLRDDIKTFILAGHETSGTTLTWAVYELMRNPEYMKIVREEHEAVFGAGAGKQVLSEDDLPSVETLRTKLNFTYAVLREVLRLYSIVPLVPRQTMQDDFILKAEWGGDSDVLIPKGCIIMIGVDGLHHRPDIWPEPEKFNPKRFINMDLVNEALFMPFIYGPRNCLGQHLSLLEASVVLSYTTYHFDFEFAKADEKQNGLERDPLLVPLAPLGGLNIVPKQRQDKSKTFPTFL